VSIDLFGVEHPDVLGPRKGGYPKPPGSGPAGETCGSCEHYTRVQRGAGVYLKCGLMEPSWTRGPGTDIKKKSPACSFWEKER
jgi:hypothetical protein